MASEIRHSEEVDRRKKCGVNKLFKKLSDTGTVDRRPSSGRPRSACTEENASSEVPAVCH